MAVPMALLLAISPLFTYGLMKIDRKFFIGAIIHTIAVSAIGGASLMFLQNKVILCIAMTQALTATMMLTMPNVRAPFLRRRTGFRQHKRYDANLRVTVDAESFKREGETIDVSVGGAYIDIPVDGFVRDTRVKLDLELRQGKNLRLPARIIAVNSEGMFNKPRGLSVQFTAMTRAERTSLETFISTGRHFERLPIVLPVSFEAHGTKLAADTVDVSLGGCYVKGAHTQCHPGDRLAMTFMLHDDDPLELIGEVMWMSLTDSSGKPPGLAIQFLSMSRSDKQRLTERLKEAGVEG
jgi:Tfp pilus assembly protein PilZ